MEDNIEWKPFPVPERRTPETPVTPEPVQEAPAEDPELGKRPETAPETPETPVVEDPEEKVREVLERWLERQKRTFTPPDIVRKDRPSLLKVIAYGWAGDWGPRTGIIRTLGKIDCAALGVPWTAVGYTWSWWGERPSRRWLGFLLIGLTVWYLKS